jgi:hypothetical protein
MNLPSPKKQNPIQNREETSADFYRPKYELGFTKKFNKVGLFIMASAYTIAVVVTTVNIVKPEKSVRHSIINESNLKAEIIRELTANQPRQADLYREISKVKQELLYEIDRVKISNENLNSIPGRLPASSNEEPISKPQDVLKFSKINKKVLSFKQYKEYQRAKEEFEQQKQLLATSLDLTKPEHVKRLKDFQDQADVKLYELRQIHEENIKELERNKFVVLNQ